MSLAKYMQFYRNKGFFNGSIIKVTVTDAKFFGQELILSKGSKIIQSKVIREEETDFFTNEGGTLTASVDNGSSVLTGNVNVSAYGTYSVTLKSINSDTNREVYPSANEVIFYLNDTQKTVDFAYTGDLAPITASTSDSSVATATVTGNKLTVNKSQGDTEATCTITATVGSTDAYDSKSVNIQVTRYGSVGTWADASDETIVNMVRLADEGTLNLHDYWHVGDTRVVTLDAITKDTGSVILAQPQQQIELVLMHDAISDTQYTLTTPVASNRTRPSFVVGMKDCLQNLSPLDFSSGSRVLTVTYDGNSYSKTINYKSLNADSWLNNKFYNALPESIRTLLKSVEVRYVKTSIETNETNITNKTMYNVVGTKSQKIALPSIYELTGAIVQMQSNQYMQFTGYIGAGVNDAYKIAYLNGGYTKADYKIPPASFDLSYEGSKLSYYDTYRNTLKKRGNNEYVAYYTRTDLDLAQVARNSYGTYTPQIIAIGIKDATLNSTSSNPKFDSKDLTSFDKDEYASSYYGISPIMFI